MQQTLGWLPGCDLQDAILSRYCTELKAVIHESVNLKEIA